MRLVLATSNAGKLRELRALLAPLGIEADPQAQWNVAPVAETGCTFAENAILKARHAASATGLPALADDSGLEVDALQGGPGIHSARYSGIDASDQENNRKLLRELLGVAQERRSARYRCVLALVHSADDASPLLCEGTWEGRIAQSPSGTNGFGYDPLFVVKGHELSAAELDPERKNAESHRGQALRKLVEALRNRAR
jgi:XTP/dITP diphosphohydrolase